MFGAWLSAFLVTQAVEMPIYRLGLSVSWSAAFAASAITHPVVWFVFFGPHVEGSYPQRLVAAELFAWTAETAWFVLLGRRQALFVALCANGASVLVGAALRALIGWP